MHPENRSACQPQNDACGCRAHCPFARIPARHLTDEPLARCPDKQREIQTGQFIEAGHEFEVFLRGLLGEAEAWIEHDLFVGNARFPRDFIDDWLGVGADEAMHFALLDRRLRTLGSHYGALPAHDGLWEAAEETAHDAAARLAVVPMVLEARGLDITPATVARFEGVGDHASARILQRIYSDEIRHVGAGTKWFDRVARESDSDPVTLWKSLVAQHFRGNLKPPFNDSARSAAGLTQEYYC